MASQSETFFEDYAMALNSDNANILSEFHLLPTIFMTDQKKKVCNDHDELMKYNTRLIENLEQAGVAKHIPLVNQAMRLSESVLFCNVRWRCFDRDDNVMFSSNCSYTLQQASEDVFKIIVVVLDGEESRIISGKLG